MHNLLNQYYTRMSGEVAVWFSTINLVVICQSIYNLGLPMKLSGTLTRQRCIP